MSQDHLKSALLKTIEGIKQDPATGKLVFRANSKWLEDVLCEATVREFQPISVDEPAELGGTDTAPNPVELVLVALGTCQQIVYSAYASVMGIPLDGVRCSLRGYLDLQGLFGLDESLPAGFQRIIVETELESDADPEQLRKLVEIVESHCPVLCTLQREVEVRGKVTLNGQPLQAEAAA